MEHWRGESGTKRGKVKRALEEGSAQMCGNHEAGERISWEGEGNSTWHSHRVGHMSVPTSLTENPKIQGSGQLGRVLCQCGGQLVPQ